MVNCSRTELTALKNAFEKPEVRLCYWHMFRTLRMQAATKLQYGEEECGMKQRRTEETFERNWEFRQAAVSGLMKLIYT